MSDRDGHSLNARAEKMILPRRPTKNGVSSLNTPPMADKHMLWLDDTSISLTLVPDGRCHRVASCRFSIYIRA